MNQRTFAPLTSIALLLLAARGVSATETYSIDPDHTSIVFSVAHAGFSYTYGMFRESSGSYQIDKTNPANSRFQLVIKTTSLFTNNVKRDDHLRSSDFFNVQQYPTITFESTRCNVANTQEGGIVYQLLGNLTMHGVTKPITVNLRMLGEGTGPYGDQRTGFLCQMELKRTDFNMNNLLEKNLVGDAVGITVSFEGALQTQSAAGTARPQ